MTKFIARQGDVLIRQVDLIPEGGKQEKRDNKRIVLAYGEVTGHTHAIHNKNVFMVVVNDNRYLKVLEPSELVHEEHDTIHIPIGNYEVIRQREYDDENEFRVVADWGEKWLKV